MVRIKAFDELLAVDILLVCRASIPEMGMPIDDENFFTLGCPVHGVSPAPARIECYEARHWRSRIGLAGSRADQALFAGNLQTMYFIISFMSPNSMTVLSSVMTMRP